MPLQRDIIFVHQYGLIISEILIQAPYRVYLLFRALHPMREPRDDVVSVIVIHEFDVIEPWPGLARVAGDDVGQVQRGGEVGDSAVYTFRWS